MQTASGLSTTSPYPSALSRARRFRPREEALRLAGGKSVERATVHRKDPVIQLLAGLTLALGAHAALAQPWIDEAAPERRARQWKQEEDARQREYTRREQARLEREQQRRDLEQRHRQELQAQQHKADEERLAREQRTLDLQQRKIARQQERLEIRWQEEQQLQHAQHENLAERQEIEQRRAGRQAKQARARAAERRRRSEQAHLGEREPGASASADGAVAGESHMKNRRPGMAGGR